MFISKSPTVVKVGRTSFKIFRGFDEKQPVIQMISKLSIQCPETGEKQDFQLPTPGWTYEQIKEVQ